MGNLTPNQQGGLTSMTLHDLFTLLIIPIRKLGTNQIQYMKYISEYIPKLQIHEHNMQSLGHVSYDLATSMPKSFANDMITYFYLSNLLLIGRCMLANKL